MIDTRIRGGIVCTGTESFRADVLVSAGSIVALVDAESDLDADTHIDADGLMAIPGLVDLHAHMRTPGLSYKEDFYTGSAAAANGGYTTFVDMPNVEPPTDSAELLIAKRQLASETSLIDFGHFASGSNPANIAGLAAAGATGFKIFMIGGGYPHDDRIAVSTDPALWTSFEEIAKTGLPCLVHPFNQALFDMFAQRELDAGKPRTYRTRTEVYTNRDVVWSSAAARAMQFQAETGVRLHLLHTHAQGTIDRLRAARAAGQRVTAAIDPKYFHTTMEEMERLGTRAYSGAYVTSNPERMAAIWAALSDGTIDIIDSDHAPHTKEENAETAVDAWKAQGGSPQYDDMFLVMLEDVFQGKLKLNDLVRLMSVNPSRLIGHYPNKGSLHPGTDADITLVDMQAETELTDARLYTKCGWTPYLGRRVHGAPVLTMVRGQVVMREGKILAEPGRARYLPGRPQ